MCPNATADFGITLSREWHPLVLHYQHWTQVSPIKIKQPLPYLKRQQKVFRSKPCWHGNKNNIISFTNATFEKEPECSEDVLAIRLRYSHIAWRADAPDVSLWGHTDINQQQFRAQNKVWSHCGWVSTALPILPCCFPGVALAWRCKMAQQNYPTRSVFWLPFRCNNICYSISKHSTPAQKRHPGRTPNLGTVISN